MAEIALHHKLCQDLDLDHDHDHDHGIVGQKTGVIIAEEKLSEKETIIATIKGNIHYRQVNKGAGVSVWRKAEVLMITGRTRTIAAKVEKKSPGIKPVKKRTKGRRK
eukprot:78393_1